MSQTTLSSPPRPGEMSFATSAAGAPPAAALKAPAPDHPKLQGASGGQWSLHLRLLVCMLFWGGAFVAGRAMGKEMGPFSSSFLRFAVASSLLVGLTAIKEPKALRPTLAQHARYGLLGLVGIFGYNWFFMEALRHVPAGRAAMIIATNPAFTALLAAPIFGETLGWRRAGGIALSLCGALTVLTHGRPWTLLADISPYDYLMIAALATWVGYSLLGKWAMRQASPLSAVAWSCVWGTVLLLPFALHEGLLPQASAASKTTWACALYLGLFPTVLSFVWYYRGINALGAARASAYINFVPVFATLLGFVLLGERLEMSTLAGGAMVILGVWTTSRR